jgi:hypothetical protein
MKVDPEFASVVDFVEYLIEEERYSFTYIELGTLAASIRKSHHALRIELETFGLRLEHRPHVKKFRGVSDNPHDRWYGPGSCKTHGCSGQDQILGFSGKLVKASDPFGE